MDKLISAVKTGGLLAREGVDGKIIEKVLDQPEEQAWIQVTERMPEEDETVLVCRKNGYMHTARYEFDCWNYCNHDINIEDVIAWMPLPEPYKEANYE